MKFTAAIVATLMGFAAANNHTNGSASTGAVTDNGNGNGNQNYTGVADKASFTADIAVGLTLPANVTAAAVTSVVIPQNGFGVPTDGCSGMTPAAKLLVCDMTSGFQTVVRDTSGDASATVSTTEVATVTRRALASAEARKLSSTNFKFSTQMVFSTDAAAQKQAAAITADTDGSAFGAALNTAVGTTYGTLTATVEATSDVVLSDGTTQTFADAAAAGAATDPADDAASSAFKVAASGLFVVLAALQF